MCSAPNVEQLVSQISASRSPAIKGAHQYEALVALKRELGLFDLTNIVVGAVIGSDIYVASALTAGLVGPFSVVLWVVAGVMAMVLALIFAYHAFYVRKVGGPYAYRSDAFKHL